MSPVLSERWLLVLSVGLAACGSERAVYHAPPVDIPISVSVTPNAVSLLCGQAVTLVASVTANAGVNRVVQWRALNALVANVDSTGLVHAGGPGVASILAVSVADPTKAGVATVTVAGNLLPSITISQVVEAGTGQPANLDAITDSIDVTFNLNDGGCLDGALPWVSVTAHLSNGQDSVTTAVPVPTPGATSAQQVKVRLNTASKRPDGTPVLHNGTYALTGVLLGSDGAMFRSANTVQLTVAN